MAPLYHKPLDIGRNTGGFSTGSEELFAKPDLVNPNSARIELNAGYYTLAVHQTKNTRGAP
jgi:hypothetical protein